MGDDAVAVVAVLAVFSLAAKLIPVADVNVSSSGGNRKGTPVWVEDGEGGVDVGVWTSTAGKGCGGGGSGGEAVAAAVAVAVGLSVFKLGAGRDSIWMDLLLLLFCGENAGMGNLLASGED